MTEMRFPTQDHTDLPSEAVMPDVLIRPENDVEHCHYLKTRQLGDVALHSYLATMKDGTQYFADMTELSDHDRKTDALVVSTTAFGTTHAGLFLKETEEIAQMGADSLVVSVPINGTPDIVNNAYAMDAIARHVRDSGTTISRGYSRGAIHAITYASIAEDKVMHGEWDHPVFPDQRDPFDKMRRHLGRFALTEGIASLAFLGQSPSSTIAALRSAEMQPRRIYRNAREIYTLTGGVVRAAAENLPDDLSFNVRVVANDGMGYAKVWSDDILSKDKFPNGNVVTHPDGGHSGYFRRDRHLQRMTSMRDAIENLPN